MAKYIVEVIHNATFYVDAEGQESAIRAVQKIVKFPAQFQFYVEKVRLKDTAVVLPVAEAQVKPSATGEISELRQRLAKLRKVVQ